MPCPLAGADSVVVSSSAASSICDGLLRMAHALIVELPEPKLREIRYTLDCLLVKADQVLDVMENDVSLNLDGLRIGTDTHYPPGAEDFGAVLVSATVSSDAGESDIGESDADEFHSGFPSPMVTDGHASVPPLAPSLLSSSSRTLVRPPTPAPSPEPDSEWTPPSARPRYPIILSSRQNVGFPDYFYHPHFVHPGIPGTYTCPPTPPGESTDHPYYAVTRGLYVGIFTDWDEVRPWVVGIPRSLYRRCRLWEDARDIYNERLAAGTIQVLT